MAFRLTTFAGVTLPTYNATWDFSTPLTRNPVVETLNGYIDFYGTRRRIDCGQEFEVDAQVDGTATDIRTLKALVGKTGYLVRVNADGTGTLQRYCRLLWVGFQPKATQRGYINKLAMRFWSNEPFWRSSSTTTHGPTAIVSGGNINLTIAGEEDVLDATLTIAASANISSITIQHDKTENSETVTSKLSYTTQLDSGHDLVINCGQYTVTDDGSDAYDGFALHADHDEVYWLRLPAGSQTLVITLGSGSGTYQLDYNAVYQ